MPETLYGGVQNRRVTIRDLQRATDAHERWAMLTGEEVPGRIVIAVGRIGVRRR